MASAGRVLLCVGRRPSGEVPYASLIDVNGTLCGTTVFGGRYGSGTVFSIGTGGSEHVLHSFGHGLDGRSAYASVIDVDGILYGTTIWGGKHGQGTVFAIKP
jgi:uncharacterized repeat protein (TIGR03803 family)